MTKKQAKIFAKIHSAITIRQTDGFAFYDCGVDISEKDEQKIIDEIYNLSDKILGSLPHKSSTLDIYDYVIKNH